MLRAARRLDSVHGRLHRNLESRGEIARKHSGGAVLQHRRFDRSRLGRARLVRPVTARFQTRENAANSQICVANMLIMRVLSIMRGINDRRAKFSQTIALIRIQYSDLV